MKKSFLFLCLFSPSLWAITAQEVANLTLERTPLIKANLQELNAFSHQVDQSTLWKNPSLSMQTGRARTGRDYGFVMDLTLMQTIPWPGAMEVMKRQSELARDLTELSNQKAELRLYHLALLMSLELSSLEKINSINLRRRSRLDAIKRYINAKVVVSDNDKIEAGMIQNQIIQVDNFSFDLKTRIQSLKTKLKRLAGVEIGVVSFYDGKLPKVSKESLLAELEQSPEWKMQTKRIELAKEEVKKVEYETKPELQVGINYRVEHLRPENEFVHANIGVSVPIWDRGQYREQAARAQLRREEAMGRINEINLMDRFDEIFQRLEVSHFQSKSFEISKIDELERKILEAEAAFKKGRINAVTLLQYDDQIQQNVNTTILSRYDFYSNLADIYEMLGKKMDF